LERERPGIGNIQNIIFQMDGMKPESTAEENQDEREESKGL